MEGYTTLQKIRPRLNTQDQTEAESGPMENETKKARDGDRGRRMKNSDVLKSAGRPNWEFFSAGVQTLRTVQTCFSGLTVGAPRAFPPRLQQSPGRTQKYSATGSVRNSAEVRGNHTRKKEMCCRIRWLQKGQTTNRETFAVNLALLGANLNGFFFDTALLTGPLD
jgi:hypothetical protein